MSNIEILELLQEPEMKVIIAILITCIALIVLTRLHIVKDFYTIIAIIGSKVKQKLKGE